MMREYKMFAVFLVTVIIILPTIKMNGKRILKAWLEDDVIG